MSCHYYAVVLMHVRSSPSVQHGVLTRKQKGVEKSKCAFFYEILVAGSVECASRTTALSSCYEISHAGNFFATFR